MSTLFRNRYQAKEILNIFLILLLLNICNIQAVLLRDGSKVSQPVVDHVYKALQSLHKQGKGDIICDLCHASRQSNRRIVPCFVKNYMDFQSMAGRIKIAASLGLCDEKGNIEEDIAHVISSSINMRCVEGNRLYTYTLHLSSHKRRNWAF